VSGCLLSLQTNKYDPERQELTVRYRTMNNNGSLQTMHAFWLVQRNIAKIQKEISNAPDPRFIHLHRILLGNITWRSALRPIGRTTVPINFAEFSAPPIINWCEA
jgi:hypothetical protein